MTPHNYDFICSFIAKQAAISLGAGKEYLVKSRLSPLAKDEGFESLDDFLDAVRKAPVINGRQSKVIDAMTTNETLFFRDLHPFEALRTQVLPEIIERKSSNRTLNIWCAACSTGQEPYSIAMLLLKHFPELASWNVRILGTDLCQRVLDAAHAAEYSQLEINRGLPATYLINYFTKTNTAWRLKDEVKRLVRFEKLNLLSPWTAIPRCDIVFIRNVLIYFDLPTKRAMLDRMKSVMTPNAYLFLGGGETTSNVHQGYRAENLGAATAFRINHLASGQAASQTNRPQDKPAQ